MQCYINRDKTVHGVLDPEEYAEDLQQLALGNKEPFLNLVTAAAGNLLETLGISDEFVVGQPKIAIYPNYMVIELKLSDDYELPESPDESPTATKQSVYKFSSMNDVIDCCRKLHPSMPGTSSLYKLDSVYYLVLSGTKNDLFRNVIIAGEFGEFVEVYPTGLFEHAKLIIEDTAVQDLHSL